MNICYKEPVMQQVTEVFMLINTIYENYTVTDNAEISFECNPDDGTAKTISL